MISRLLRNNPPPLFEKPGSATAACSTSGPRCIKLSCLWQLMVSLQTMVTNHIATLLHDSQSKSRKSMALTIDCRDTINCKDTIVLCNGAQVRIFSRNSHPAERYSSHDIMINFIGTWRTHSVIYEKFHFQELIPSVRVGQYCLLRWAWAGVGGGVPYSWSITSIMWLMKLRFTHSKWNFYDVFVWYIGILIIYCPHAQNMEICFPPTLIINYKFRKTLFMKLLIQYDYGETDTRYMVNNISYISI